MRKRFHWLAFSPVFVAVTLMILLILSPSTGFGPNSNVYALCALAAIPLGLVLGLIGLIRANHLSVWWRVILGLLFLPIAVMSLLMAGF